MKSRFIQKLRGLQTRLLEALVSANPGLGLEERAEFFISLFENEIPKSSRVLDIGGRWGFYAKPLEKRGHCPLILDVVRPKLQNAPVIIYDGATMPFPDKSFDTSLFVTVLHHIQDMDQVLLEAKRVTRNRIIVIEDLYHHAFGRFWTILRDRFYNLEWVGHPCGFKTKTQWEQYFGQHGFYVRSCREVVTRLCGLKILNGVFVLEIVR